MTGWGIGVASLPEAQISVGVFHATGTGHNLDVAPRFAAQSDLICINGQYPVLGYGEGYILP